MAEKSILKQYRDLIKESEELKRRISKTMKQLERINKEGVVKDKVRGGYGGQQSFQIEGFPIPAYSKKESDLRKKLEKYEKCRTEIDKVTLELIDFINEIPVSRDRMIYRYFYIDGMSQQSIASKLYMAQSAVSKTLSKYE